MNQTYRIELLGILKVVHGTETVSRFRTSKAASLLAYFAFNLGKSHTREHLIDIFWPELEIDSARDNLSTTLYSLRRQFESREAPPGHFLVADRQTVGLNAENVSTDVIAFENLIQEAEVQTGSQQTSTLGAAVALFQGEPLSGQYDDWALNAQAALKEKEIDTLALWSDALGAEGDLPLALTAAKRASVLDPFREGTCRRRMSLLVRTGESDQALEEYRKFEQRLNTDLGIAPSASLREFAKTIETCDLASLEETSGAARSKPSVDVKVVASPNLPAQFTRLFGRETEIEEVAQLLEAKQASKVVTLTGPGGAGKSRLSIAIAERISDRFSGGVWFIPLAEVTSTALIPFALCDALGVKISDKADPFDQAVETLNKAGESGPCLLILDNMEQLLTPSLGSKGERFSDGSTLIRLLLERASSVTCLITSRQPLRLGGERQYAVPPLQTPTTSENTGLGSLLSVDAVALFVDRAQAVRSGFALTPANASDICRICRQLAGMPLAIEMAAAWVKVLTPARILERMDKQLELLVNRRSDLPLRHQTMRATIAWSYDLLDAPLRSLFASLSVFRKGTTIEAVEQVCLLHEASTQSVLEELAELQSCSLVNSHDEGDNVRFDMLEPLREFAAERLETLGIADEVHNRHAAYFLSLAVETEKQLSGSDTRQGLLTLDRENENVRAALEHLRKHNGLGLVEAVCNLRTYWAVRGRYYEAMEWYRACIDHPDGKKPTQERAHVLISAANIAWNQGRFTEAKTLIESAREVSEACDFAMGKSLCLTTMSNILWYEGNRDAAEPMYERALAFCREIGYEKGIAVGLSNLALVKMDRREFDAARALFIESMDLRLRMGNEYSIATILLNLGELDVEQGHYEAALAHLSRCHEIAKSNNDTVTEGYVLHALGRLASKTGDSSLAFQHLLSSLEIRQETNERFYIGKLLLDLAELAETTGQLTGTVTLLGLADRTWKQMGTKMAKEDAEQFSGAVDRLKRFISTTEFEAAWAKSIASANDQVAAASRAAISEPTIGRGI